MPRALRTALLLLTASPLLAGHPRAGEGPPPAPAEAPVPMPPALGPGGIERELAVAERYFEAGRYAEAARRYEALLEHPDAQALAPLPALDPATIPQAVVEERLEYAARRLARQRLRERAHFYYARSLLELGEVRPGALETALQELRFLAQNRRGIAQPQFALEARLWMGRAYLRMDRPAEAAEALRALLDLSPPMALDARASQLYATALLDQVRSFPEGRGAAERDRILKRALSELNRIRIYYPNHPERQSVEVRLIELHLELRDFLKAAELADSFLRSERAPPELLKEARLYRARAAYALGEVERAAEMYGRVLSAEPAGSPLRAEAEFGLGWSFAQLATSAGPTERPRLLAQAQGSLSRALAGLPEEHPQRPRVRYALAEVLVRLGEWEKALATVEPLFDAPALRLRAHALAGVALRGAGRPGEALGHYERVLRRADGGLPLGFLLENRFDAAAIREEEGRPGLALGLYLRAGSEARRLRNWPLAARADLGAARTLIDLGDRAETGRDDPARRVAGTLLPLLAGPPRTAEAPEASARLEEALRAYVHAAEAGPGSYDRALRILELLRLRHSDRVRGDELDYEEGRAYFLKARALAAELLPGATADPDRLRPAFDLYARAAEVMERGARANPQSSFAPRVSFVLGRIQQERGRLLMRLAADLRQRDELAEARLYEEQARLLLAESAQTFLVAIQSAGEEDPLRLEAQETLAGVYRELEEYARAAEEYQSLAEDPRAGPALRIRARRLWARSLSDIGRTDEAVRRLQPFVAEDPATALLAGELYESLGRLEEARAAYEGGLAACRRTVEDCGPLRAELGFRLYRLVLRRTEALFGSEQLDARRDEAVRQLRAVAARHPETDWAVRALEEAGDHLLAQGEWREARAVAQAGQEAAGEHPLHARRLGLLEARALVAGGRLETAETILREIAAAPADGPAAEALAAAAIRERGTIAALRGEADAALRLYARVFAEYTTARDEADRARIAAADLYAQEGRYELALSVLADAHDPTLVRPYRERIEAMARSDAR